MELHPSTKAFIRHALKDPQQFPKLLEEWEFFFKKYGMAGFSDYAEYIAEIVNTNPTIFPFWLIQYQPTYFIKELINAGLFLNTHDFYGNSLLHYASWYNKNDLVDFIAYKDIIFEHNLMPEALVQNNEGRSPLDMVSDLTHRKLQDKLNQFWTSRAAKRTSVTTIARTMESQMHIGSSMESVIVAGSRHIETKIDNSTQWQDVICMPQELSIAKPTGYIEWNPGKDKKTGASSGTASLISEDLLITAGHCARDEETNETALPEELKVSFSYQIPKCGIKDHSNTFDDFKKVYPSVTDVFYVDKVVEVYEDERDYAILRLKKNPGLTYSFLTLSTENPTIGSDVSVVQHPDGLPKKVATGKVVAYDTPHERLAYHLDTDHGSSGGPVIWRNKLIGVHTNGFLSDAKPVAFRKNNSGETISSLSKISPTIASLIEKGLFASKKEKPVQQDRRKNDREPDRERGWLCL